VIARAVLFDVFVFHLSARHGSRTLKSLENGNDVRSASTDIINLAAPWVLGKGMNEPGDVQRMNVVTDLLAFVTKHTISLPLDVAFDKVAEEPMQLDTAMIRPGQATSAQAAGLHPEVTSLFLHHDIRRHFRSAENAMLGLVNRKLLGNAVIKAWVVVVPPCSLLEQGD